MPYQNSAQGLSSYCDMIRRKFRPRFPTGILPPAPGAANATCWPPHCSGHIRNGNTRGIQKVPTCCFRLASRSVPPAADRRWAPMAGSPGTALPLVLSEYHFLACSAARSRLRLSLLLPSFFCRGLVLCSICCSSMVIRAGMSFVVCSYCCFNC